MQVLILAFLEYNLKLQSNSEEWYCTMFKYAFRVDDERLSMVMGSAIKTGVLLSIIKESPKFLEIFDFDAIDSSDIVTLLLHDYDTFFPCIKIENIRLDDMVDLFLSNPDRYVHHLDIGTLKRDALNKMAAVRPSAFLKYNLDITKLKPNMVARILDSKNCDQFTVNAIAKITNKTDYRSLLIQFQDIIPKLTIEQLQAAPLDAKQLLLLRKNFNKGIDYQPEIIKALSDNFTLDVIIGKSTVSKHTKKVTGPSK